MKGFHAHKKQNGGAETKSWLSESRQALIGQILSILMIPLSIFLTLYFTELNRKAEASIEYGESIAYFNSITGAPSNKIRERIINDSKLYNNFLIRLDGQNPVPKTAKSWLNDNGPWDEDCQDIYKDLSIAIKTDLIQFLSDDAINSRIPPNVADKSKRSLETLNRFLVELDSINSLPKTPRGKLEITLGILNKTGYDGLIEDDVTVSFGNKSFHITSDSGFIQLKPHYLQKYSFTTFDLSDNGEDLYKSNGNVMQTFTDTTAEGKKKSAVMKEFAQLVKDKKAIPISITVRVDDKELKPHETVVKYSDD